MAEVLVVFPQGGSAGSPTDARINEDLVRAAQGNRLNWDFLSCEASIQSALVYFEDSQSKFFKVNGNYRNWYAKDLSNHKENIWGLVPKYGKPPGNPAIAAKYWVMGFAKAAVQVEADIAGGATIQQLRDDAISVLDPIVVTGDPT